MCVRSRWIVRVFDLVVNETLASEFRPVGMMTTRSVFPPNAIGTESEIAVVRYSKSSSSSAFS